jgi:light-regulated signal transduction histidine kinase (bacteriophytochrome)
VKVGKGLAVDGENRLVRVALQNLLGNAWKFTSKRPAARIEFGSLRSNGSQAYFVQDNGAGFDQAYAARLFGAFQRLHSMDEFPGTGIGLATVQRIIHRHGGKVWAEGAVNLGVQPSISHWSPSTRPEGANGRKRNSAGGRQSG